MKGIVLVVVLAIIVEALIEYAKSIYKAFAKEGWKPAVTQVAAILIAVLLCFATGADLFGAMGLVFAWPWIGVALTGVIISRGANYVSDFMKKLQGVSTNGKA